MLRCQGYLTFVLPPPSQRSTPEGRAALLRSVTEVWGGSLDCLVRAPALPGLRASSRPSNIPAV